MPDVKTNKYGINANIKAHILPDEKMKAIGFTDHNPKSWYFCKYWDDLDLSFNVCIIKDDPDDLRIDVLDEAFCQPYDYQSILSRHPDFKVALMVKDRTDRCMTYLINNGVLSNWKVGDYL